MNANVVSDNEMMKAEYKLVLINPSGLGFITRTPTQADIESELRSQTSRGWKLIQVLTLGLFYRKTWLVLGRDSNEAMSSEEMK